MSCATGLPAALSVTAFRPRLLNALLPALAVAQGVLLVTVPSVPFLAIGLWWNANTIAHNFIHRPFFRSRLANGCFSAYTSLLLGIPQSVWRERHLAHHAGRAPQLRYSSELVFEISLVGALWTTLVVLAPMFFLTTYLPGYALGLALCGLQGHYEHAGGTTSHYGWLYNALCFNDGYHVEHHARPGMHWSELPRCASGGGRASRWPPVLRALDALSLETLERCVLRSVWLQRAVLAVHRRALARALAAAPAPQRIVIVGGGLFPRTALILQSLFPGASISVVDANAANIERAQTFGGISPAIEFVHRRFTACERLCDVDLLIVPLAFQGDRRALYQTPPAPTVLIHDWIWRWRSSGCVISLWLLKRLNVVRQ